jgi:hypothetical protein
MGQCRLWPHRVPRHCFSTLVPRVHCVVETLLVDSLRRTQQGVEHEAVADRVGGHTASPRLPAPARSSEAAVGPESSSRRSPSILWGMVFIVARSSPAWETAVSQCSDKSTRVIFLICKYLILLNCIRSILSTFNELTETGHLLAGEPEEIAPVARSRGALGADRRQPGLAPARPSGDACNTPPRRHLEPGVGASRPSLGHSIVRVHAQPAGVALSSFKYHSLKERVCDSIGP